MNKLNLSVCRGQTKKLYRTGRNVLLGIMILYTLISSFIVSPLMQLLTKIALKASSEGYVVNNMSGIFSKPLYLIALIACLLFSLIWSFCSFGILVNGFGMLRRGEKVTLKGICGRTLRCTLRAMQPRNWMMLVMSGIVIPFVMPMSVTDFIQSVSLPEYILDSIYTSVPLLILYGAFVIFLIIVVIRSMFLYNAFILEDMTWAQARRKSHATLRGNWIRCLWGQFVAKLSVLWKALLASVVLGAALLGVSLLVRNDALALACSVAWGYFFAPLCTALGDALLDIIGFAALDSEYVLLNNSEAALPDAPSLSGKPLRRFAPACAILCGVLGIACIALMTTCPEKVLSYIEPGDVTITAHRGYTLYAAENTLKAFEDAIDSGIIEYGELDVQETKDGAVVINHDPNLLRTTGDSSAVYELTLDEIKKLSVTTAARATGESVSAPIPTLDEVIQLCKSKAAEGEEPMKLNIEIKNFAETPNLIRNTVRIIEENDFVDYCVVTSLAYSDLEAVKELNPNIRCGYTINSVDGDFYNNLPACDMFSIETTMIDSELVSNVHELGKEVHCWTVMTSEVAQEMENCGVDSIITNDPLMVRAALAENDSVPLQLMDLYYKITGKDNAEADIDNI